MAVEPMTISTGFGGATINGTTAIAQILRETPIDRMIRDDLNHKFPVWDLFDGMGGAQIGPGGWQARQKKGIGGAGNYSGRTSLMPLPRTSTFRSLNGTFGRCQTSCEWLDELTQGRQTFDDVWGNAVQLELDAGRKRIVSIAEDALLSDATG